MTHATETIREGRYEQFVGKAREEWGDLTDQEMEQFKGNMQQAMGYLKEKYGEAANAFERRWNDESMDEDM